MKATTPLALFLLATALPATAAAQGEPAPSPKLLFMLGTETFTGSASSFQQATNAYIDSYYIDGDCTAANDWTTCDDILFGLSVHAGRACDDCLTVDGSRVNLLDPTAACSPSTDGATSYMHHPGEDVGKDVKQTLQLIHNNNPEKYCVDPAFVNHDTGLIAAWEKTFPNTVNATTAELSEYWGTNVDPPKSRPHLNFMLIKGFPQSADGSDDGRLYRSIAQACTMADGGFTHTGVACTSDAECVNPGETCECPNLQPNCTSGMQCAHRSGLPSNPIWVLTERKNSEPEAVYAGLIAAAGRSGTCSVLKDGTWQEIDVCEAIANPAVTSATIKQAILDGIVKCGPGDGQAETGALDYRNSTGTLGEIQCHMYGTRGNNTCSNAFNTDLMGIFQCIRQLPRAVAPEDAVIRICPDGIGVDDGNVFNDDCMVLRESLGEIEFIDPNRTLFVIVSGQGAEGTACTEHTDCRGLCVNGLCDATSKCDGGSIEAFECPYGPCDTGLAGRCAAGEVACPDGQLLCIPKSDAFPEICNGLDDDCNGSVDDMKESWTEGIGTTYTLPDDHAGLHCNMINVCSCPDGATDTHNGTDWDTFLDGWSGICECGEGLAPDTYTPAPGDDPSFDSDPQAACAAVASDDGVPALFLTLIALGFAPLLRRRR